MFGIFVRNLVKAIDNELPGFIHPCPYKGLVAVYGVNPENLVNLTIPQIIPTGLYKAVFRVHTLSNASIVDIVGTVQFDSKDIMKRMDIG